MNISRRQFILGTTGAGLGLIAINGFAIEPNDVEYTFHEIGTRTLGGRAIRFAQLSDLHLSGVRGMHEDIATRLRSLDLDLLFITGDAIDNRYGLSDLDKLLSLLPREIPLYAIPGNWEYWGKVDMRALAELYAHHGGRLLINATETATVRGERLQIIGIDDAVGGMPSIETALRGTPPEEHALVLAHCPIYREYLTDYQLFTSSETGRIAEPIDLASYPIACMLSGHTHGGQIAVFGIRPFLPPGSGDYIHGWYRGRGPDMYVSRGIGTSILPVRMGARPEVAVFTMWT